MLELSKKNKILVVAAHPDDEILGCGGTIAKFIDQGHEVRTIIMAEGITSRDEVRSPDLRQKEIEALQETCKKANTILGVEKIDFLKLPDNRMDSINLLDIVKKLSPLIENYSPDLIYTHSQQDLNIDHRITFESVITACRPLPGQNTKGIFSFEIPSSTDWFGANNFQANMFADITKYLTIKLKALALYESEMRPWPHARSMRALESLASWRGATVGKEAAEAFFVNRIIL